MDGVDVLERGRRAFEARAWSEALAAFVAAGVGDQDSPDDLVRMATSAVLVGRDDEGCELFGRAHRAYLARGDVAAAVRCAFWTSLNLASRGQEGRAGGWLGRTEHAAEQTPPGSTSHAYLALLHGRRAFLDGDPERGARLAGTALDVAERTGEADVAALARMGLGEVELARGRTAAGCALLDEVMVAVTSGEVSEIASGVAYCAVISLCRRALDITRAREWTSALADWCDRQPDLVPFRGECLVHRSEVLLEHDDWPEALAVADSAVARLSAPATPALGLALYQKGEVHRLRGEHAAAAEAYRQANQRGTDPQPGLSLLRLAAGDVDAAVDGIRRALVAGDPPVVRRRLLPAAVEVLVAAGDVAGARSAAAELDEAAQTGSACVTALAAQARGRVLLGAGDPGAAVAALRQAWVAWRDLDVPYEAARTRVLLATACRQLGDDDGAALELDAARWVFAQLGAGTDLAAVDRMTVPAVGGGLLTPREVEVLRLVATGRTNRAIAATLVISEKTVARHLSNVFAKLGVPSRAAATAYAYEHRLV